MTVPNPIPYTQPASEAGAPSKSLHPSSLESRDAQRPVCCPYRRTLPGGELSGSASPWAARVPLSWAGVPPLSGTAGGAHLLGPPLEGGAPFIELSSDETQNAMLSFSAC